MVSVCARDRKLRSANGKGIEREDLPKGKDDRALIASFARMVRLVICKRVVAGQVHGPNPRQEDFQFPSFCFRRD